MLTSSQCQRLEFITFTQIRSRIVWAVVVMGWARFLLLAPFAPTIRMGRLFSVSPS